MKIELTVSQPVPCSGHTAFAGMIFEVVGNYYDSQGVWIMHMGHLLFVDYSHFVEHDEQQRTRDFIHHRAILQHTRSVLDCAIARPEGPLALSGSRVCRLCGVSGGHEDDCPNAQTVPVPKAHSPTHSLSHSPPTLPCGCPEIGVVGQCPLHDLSPSPFNVHPNGRPL